MKIIGNWCQELHTAEGAAEYVNTYKESHYQTIVNNELFNTRFFNNTKFKYIAFVEPADSSIPQLFILEEHDWIKTYAGCKGQHLGTDGNAFFELVRGGERIGMWCIENSPWDINEDLIDEDSEHSIVTLISNANALLTEAGLEPDAILTLDRSNILFVSFL